jgi:Fe-S-cluster-containing hydrogenase component 2
MTDSVDKLIAGETVQRMESIRVPRSGAIEVDESLCLTCRECEVACSLYHEGECNPSLSRIRIVYDDFVPGVPAVIVCKQCDWPACYDACVSVALAAQRASGDQEEPAMAIAAMRIDAASGARYIDPEACRGCGACLRACPLTPERSVIGLRSVGRKRVYFKCDLCYDRPEGPVCVQICPGHALAFVPAEERRK